jgi:type II secretory pathway component PulJ
MLLLVLFLFVPLAFQESEAIEFRYHNHAQLTVAMQDLATRFPTKAALVEIGKSRQGLPS